MAAAKKKSVEKYASPAAKRKHEAKESPAMKRKERKTGKS
jgi:hypothetical protein